MTQRFYPAVLERDPAGVHAVWFPNFPGCVVAAKSQEDVMAKAQEALAAALQAVAEQDRPAPEPTAFDAIALPPKSNFVAFVAVGASPPDPSERVNVYLPKSLIHRADRAAAALGMSRSSYFGLAVSRMLGWPASAAPFPPGGRRKPLNR